VELNALERTVMYWSFDKIPEFAEKSAAERKTIVKIVTKLAIKHWELWAALVFACSAAALGVRLGGTGVNGAIGGGIGGAVGGAVYQLVVIHVSRKYHAATLRGMNAA